MHRPATTARHITSRKSRRLDPAPEALEGRMLLSAGQLDPTFSGDGYALIAPSGGSKNQYAYGNTVEVLPDGKLLVGGYDNGNFSMIRLNPNGTLDGTFGSGGRAAPTKGSASDMAIQANGRIVLVGNVVNQVKGGTSDTDIAVARYNLNGSLDTSFGGDGSVSTAISTVTSTGAGANKADWATAVAIQPTDQKILVGGYIYAGADYSNSVIVRYNTNGSLDSTFGEGGKLVTPIGVGEDAINDIAALPDGRILAVGFTRDSSGRSSMYVARYNSDGTADGTFGTGGSGLVVTTIGATGHTNATSASILPDGRILVSGYHGNSPNLNVMLARFTSTGALDDTFGGGSGFAVADGGASESANGMTVQPDGKIVVVGRSNPSTGTSIPDSFLARFLSDGTPDSGFGGGGFVVSSFSTATDFFQGVALQGDGKIVAVGNSRTESARSVTDNILVARFLGDSSPLLATSLSRLPVDQTLTASQAGPVLSQALAYWRSRGADTSRLGHIDLAIADLGGNRLGEASGSNITLDNNAAGWGWHVGHSARVRKTVTGRMDLLSALIHEVGHLLGRGHAEGGVMAETMAPGVRGKLITAPLSGIIRGPGRLTIEALPGRGGRHRAVRD